MDSMMIQEAHPQGVAGTVLPKAVNLSWRGHAAANGLVGTVDALITGKADMMKECTDEEDNIRCRSSGYVGHGWSVAYLDGFHSI